MQIPLANKLKKRMHTEIAALQDELVDIIYEIDKQAVLHGGTAIWRCYNGNRFSEDLDFYSGSSDDFRGYFETKLKNHALSLLKFKKTKNVIFSKISNGTVEVRFEINIKNFLY